MSKRSPVARRTLPPAPEPVLQPAHELQSPGVTGASGTSCPGDNVRKRPVNGRPLALTAVERDRLVRSVVSSQALEGVEVGYEETSRLLDDVLREPLVEIG